MILQDLNSFQKYGKIRFDYKAKNHLAKYRKSKNFFLLMTLSELDISSNILKMKILIFLCLNGQIC